MGIKILLADDSVTAQNMGKKILSEAGHDVVTVSNGAAAAKKIAEIKPDLVLLDVFMPGYSGLELCERLRNSADNNKLPVLLTVGRMEPYSAQDGARVKADGVIIKPFEATDLTAAVERLTSKTKSSKTLAWKGDSKSAQPSTPPEAKSSEKPNSYDQTMRLDPAEIAKMLAGKSSPTAEVAPAPGESSGEEFNVTPLDRREVRSADTATPAFAEDLPHSSAPKAVETAMVPAFAMEDLSPAAKPSDESISAPAVPESFAVERFDVEDQQASVMAADGLELTAAAPVTELTVVSEASLEPTLQSADPNTVISKDPALETNAHTAVTDFPTQFGTPEPAEDPVSAMHPVAVNDNVIASSDAMLDAALRSHSEAQETPQAAPPDDFESRLQAAMSVYEEPSALAESSTAPESQLAASNQLETSAELTPESHIVSEAADVKLIESVASATPEYAVSPEPAPDFISGSQPLGASAHSQEFTPLAMEDGIKTPQAMPSLTGHAELSAPYAELVQASVEAVSAAEIGQVHSEVQPGEPAVELPESDEAVIQQMRDAFSELPIDHPVGQIHGESIPKAMAAAAAFTSAPLISRPGGLGREVESQIADSLASAMSVQTSAGEAVIPINAGHSDNGDANHVASAVDHVLQRELPTLVWKIMAELDLRKNGK